MDRVIALELASMDLHDLISLLSEASRRWVLGLMNKWPLLE